jgi:hypothetical protein
MMALFAESECGPRRPEPIPTPSRVERDQATLNAGTHPASGAPLRETPPGEADRCCRSCAFCGVESDRPGRLVCIASAIVTGEPQRTQLGWPACVAFVPEPPPAHDGQTAIPDGAA